MPSHKRDKETQHTWDAISELYASKFMQVGYYDASYDAFLEVLPGNRVLDVCCGPGNISRYLKNKNPDLKITGVDYAPGMIDQAKKFLPDDEFFCGDFMEFESQEASFDGFICGFGIPYVEPNELPQWLHRSSFLLKPGGAMYLSFVEGDSVKSGYKTGTSGLRAYFNYHPMEDLRRHLDQSGFSLLRSFEIPYPTGDSSHDLHQVLLLKKIN